MATCPECEFDEIDTEDLEEGDRLSCPECGKNLVVVGNDELDVADDEDDEDLDDDDLDDDDDVFYWPWLYAVEVGYWDLTDAQAAKLREYLLRGGFLLSPPLIGVLADQTSLRVGLLSVVAAGLITVLLSQVLVQRTR